MALFIDPDDPDLIDKINSLTPSPGYCIFIDIVESTKLKDKGVKHWVAFIYSTLTNAMGLLPEYMKPLKNIGDELMFYVSERILHEHHGSALKIFSALYWIANSKDPGLREVKISVAYCTDAYEISFFNGTDDVYGKDIDLSARLLNRAYRRELIMNEEFIYQVRCDLAQVDEKNMHLYPGIAQIVGPWPERFKGFAHYKNIYKIPCLDQTYSVAE